LVLFALAALSMQAAPSFADDAAALLGNWRVPPFEQQRMRMSEQCQQNADTNVQNVAESEVEVFSCDDPKFAAQKARIKALEKSSQRLATELAVREGRELHTSTVPDANGLRRITERGSIDEAMRARAQAFTAAGSAVFLVICEDPPCCCWPSRRIPAFTPGIA